MNRVCFKILILVLVFASGCAWFHSTKNVSLQRKEIKGQLVDVGRLQKGGKLFVASFQAGVNVAADAQLDKVVLMMVKGLADELNQTNGKFEVIGVDRAQEADFIFSGHVTSIQEPSSLSKWTLLKSANKISVEGKLVDASSRGTIFVFIHNRQEVSSQNDQAQISYNIGKDIGRYMVGVSRNRLTPGANPEG